MAGVVRLGLEKSWFLRGWMGIEEVVAPSADYVCMNSMQNLSTRVFKAYSSFLR